MSNIISLDKEAKEYFYSLPLAVQERIVQSDLEITCREDIQRYFTNVVNVRTDNNTINSNLF